MDLPALLDAIATGPISGEALAARFSVSRAMVWKGVQALRAEGLTVAARGGYHLVPTDALGPTVLAWRCGRPVEFHPSCTSTNQLARERMAGEGPAAEGPAAEGPGGEPGVLVVADHQTEGRGRRGRSWDSAPGQNLLFSLGLRPAVAPDRAARCVLIWAAAMAEVMDLRLKWPNDLVTPAGRKIAGILAQLDTVAEPFGAGARVRGLVLGVGVNVNQTAFEGLPDASSLAIEQGGPLDRAELFGRLVRAVVEVDVHAVDALSRWRARSHTLGRRVRVAGIEGTADGLREDGALLVDGRPVLAGDVELVGIGGPGA